MRTNVLEKQRATPYNYVRRAAYIYANPALWWIVHSPALSNAHRSMRRDAGGGRYRSTQWQGARFADWTELPLCARPLNRGKRCISARNSVKHGAAAATNFIFRRIGLQGCHRTPRSHIRFLDDEIREESFVRSIKIE